MNEKLQALANSLRNPHLPAPEPAPEPAPTPDDGDEFSGPYTETEAERGANTDRIVECAMQLRKHRLSYDVISGYVGVSHTTIMRWCKARGVKPLRNPKNMSRGVDDILQELATLPRYSARAFTSRDPLAQAQAATAASKATTAATKQAERVVAARLEPIERRLQQLQRRTHELEVANDGEEFIELGSQLRDVCQRIDQLQEQLTAAIAAMKAIGSANVELRNRINKLEEDFYAEPDGSD